MLLLFDIDGTLLSCGGAGRRALSRAFERVLGARGALDSVRLAGSTDLLIIEEGFKAGLGRAPFDGDPVGDLVEEYFRLLVEELEAPQSRYRVLNGVHALLDALTDRAEHLVGLATGNFERGARIKLRHGALDHYFAFGGFGTDGRLRHELLRAAIARGQALAMDRFGRRFDESEILVIGDTEQDVAAAKAVGVKAVGVLEGAHGPEALRAAEPDLLFDSLADERFWSLLSLSDALASAARSTVPSRDQE